MRDYQFRLNLRDFLIRHRSVRVWYLRQRHQCGHLGPAVRFCYCDPRREQHWRDTPNAFRETL